MPQTGSINGLESPSRKPTFVLCYLLVLLLAAETERVRSYSFEESIVGIRQNSTCDRNLQPILFAVGSKTYCLYMFVFSEDPKVK